MSPTRPITVVVVFYSRGGATENLAHAAAVGAVQARALIRLRRVGDTDRASVLARFPGSKDSLRRMHNEYVEPKETDVLAADVLILGSPPDVGVSAPEWQPFLDMLKRLQSEQKLPNKVAVAIPSGDSDAFSSTLRQLGLHGVSEAADAGNAVAQAVALGRAAVAAAERRRNAV